MKHVRKPEAVEAGLVAVAVAEALAVVAAVEALAVVAVAGEEAGIAVAVVVEDADTKDLSNAKRRRLFWPASLPFAAAFESTQTPRLACAE
jgi:hypothetical protein